MRYLIVGLNYGVEIAPTLAFLQTLFPEVKFTVESQSFGLIARDIFAAGPFDASQLDRMRASGAAFRDGFAKGWIHGWNDRGKSQRANPATEDI